MDGCGSLRRFDRTQDRMDQVEALKGAETIPPELVPIDHWIRSRFQNSFCFRRKNDPKMPVYFYQTAIQFTELGIIINCIWTIRR